MSNDTDATETEVAADEPRTVSLAEAAALSGLSEGALRQALADGRLQGARRRRRWEIPVTDLERFAKEAPAARAGRGGVIRAVGSEALADAMADLVRRYEEAVERAAAGERRLAESTAREARLLERAEQLERKRESLESLLSQAQADLAAVREDLADARARVHATRPEPTTPEPGKVEPRRDPFAPTPQPPDAGSLRRWWHAVVRGID